MTNPQAMTVMAVSPDRSVLQQLHRLLSDFGFSVLTKRELSWDVSGLLHVTPHFLLIDRRSLDEAFRPLETLRELHPAPYPYVFMLYHEPSDLDVVQAVEVGVDDFLAIPINRAEVVARLRAGTRILNLRRLGEDLLHTDHETGLLTGSGFLRLLRRRAETTERPGVCMMIELDHFSQTISVIGWPAAKRIMQAVANALRELCGASSTPARWRGYRFSVLMPHTSIERARKLVETMRQRTAFSDALKIDGLKLTTSVGIGSWSPKADRPEDLIRRTEGALQQAIENGRNTIVAAGEENYEGDEGIQGHDDIFASAKARDVMTPVAVVVDSGESVNAAASRLRHSRLDILPVVDHRRRLLGVIRAEQVAPQTDAAANRPVHQVMCDAVVRIQEETPLVNLINHFVDARLDLAVVVNGDVPKGIVTQTDLIELMSPVLHDYPALKSLHDRGHDDNDSNSSADSGNRPSSFTIGVTSGEHARVDDRSANA